MRTQNRWSRRLVAEQLETRQLMAVDVRLSGNVLSFVGNRDNDQVVITFDGISQRLNIRNNGVSGGSVDARQVAAIDVNLGAGRDRFELNSPVSTYPRPGDSAPLSLSRLSIQMGPGTSDGRGREGIVLRNVIVNNLQVNGSSNNGVNFDAGGLLVTGQLRAEFGGGDDILGLHSGSVVNQLFARFGDGEDTLSVSGGAGDSRGRAYYNQVNRSDVNMGSGRDILTIARNSNILSGSVNGGDATNDTANIDHVFATVGLAGFERITRPRA